MQVLDAKISVMQKLDILVCCFGLRKVHKLQESPAECSHGHEPCHNIMPFVGVALHTCMLRCRGLQVCNCLQCFVFNNAV